MQDDRRTLFERRVRLGRAFEICGGMGLSEQDYRKMSALIDHRRNGRSTDLLVGGGGHIARTRDDSAFGHGGSSRPGLVRTGSLSDLRSAPGPSRSSPSSSAPLREREPFKRNVLRHRIEEKVRQPFSMSQLHDISELLRSWNELGADIFACADDAHTELEAMIAELSTQRSELVALAGRVTWLVLSICCPAWQGPAIGALVRGVFSEDIWTNGLAKMGEWWLQVPEVADANTGKAAPTLRWGAPNRITRWARAKHLGGHPQVRDTKDFPQVLNNIHKCFGNSKWGRMLTEINRKTVMRWYELDKPGRLTGGEVLRQLTEVCQVRARAVTECMSSLMREFAGRSTNLDALIDAAHLMQFYAIDQQMQRDPRYDATELVGQGVDLFINTFAHKLVSTVYGSTLDRTVPKLNKTAAKQQLQRLILAEYLRATTSLPRVDPESGSWLEPIRGRWAQHQNRRVATKAAGGSWAKDYGTVKSSVWTQDVEALMITLGITTRVTDHEKLRSWNAPVRGARTKWEAVPFTVKNRAAEGRVAAWAKEYAELPVEQLLSEFWELLPRHIRSTL